MRTLVLPERLIGPALLLAGISAACTGIIGTGDPGEAGPNGSTPGSPDGGLGAGTGGTNGSESSPGGGGGAGVATLPGGVRLNGAPAHYRVVRLTHEQWENTVRDVFGLPGHTGLSSGFFPDPPSGKFQNNEKSLYVSDTLRNDYQRAADDVAETIAGDPAALERFGSSADPAGFIRNLGRRLFRRPLSEGEEARYQALLASGRDFYESGNDFVAGARAVIEAMLQSPYFLFRVELSPEGTRLSGYELATKLSFLLRNTTPDDALLGAAESGELDSDEGLANLAEQLLSEPAATAVLERFHTELLGLSRYGSIFKDQTLFPTYTEELNPILQEADRLFFRRVFDGGFGFREILTSNVAYVDEATAPFYGITASGSGFTEVTLDGSRPGFLTRLGFLAYNATLREPDPIHRGLDINSKLLCVEVAPPPGEIPPLPDFDPGQTNRERVTAHTGEGVCGNCHNTVINPPGFALEGFDAMGQAREFDNGKPVDTTGEFLLGDTFEPFEGIVDFAALLSESWQAHGCYAANLTEFALARDVAGGEGELVTSLQRGSVEEDSSIKDILMTIIRSPAFVLVQGGDTQ